MTALLKFIPAWAWAALGGLVLALVVGGGQQIRIVGLQGELDGSRQALVDGAGRLGACRATRTNLLELTIEQNSELADLRSAADERSAQARQAQQQAEGAAVLADQRAQQILQEQLPPGSDACAAASQAFDDELKRERGL